MDFQQTILDAFPVRIPDRTVKASVMPTDNAQIADGDYSPSSDSVRIPVTDSCYARTVRMHEASHAIWTKNPPPDCSGKDYLEQGILDALIHLRMDTPGVPSAQMDEVVYACHRLGKTIQKLNNGTAHDSALTGVDVLKVGAIVSKSGCPKALRDSFDRAVSRYHEQGRDAVKAILKLIDQNKLGEAKRLASKLFANAPMPPQRGKATANPSAPKPDNDESKSESKSKSDEPKDESKPKSDKADKGDKESKDKADKPKSKPEPKDESDDSDGDQDGDQDEAGEDESDSGSDSEDESGSESGDDESDESSDESSDSSDKSDESSDSDDSGEGSESDGDGESDDDSDDSGESGDSQDGDSQDGDGDSDDDGSEPGDDGNESDEEHDGMKEHGKDNKGGFGGGSETREDGESDEDDTPEFEDDGEVVPVAEPSMDERRQSVPAELKKAEEVAKEEASRRDSEDGNVTEVAPYQLKGKEKDIRFYEDGVFKTKKSEYIVPKMYVHTLDANVPRKVVGAGRATTRRTTTGLSIRGNRLALAAASPANNTRLFERKLQGGTILLDASGSMSISDAQLYEIAEKVPAGKVAYYSGTSGEPTVDNPPTAGYGYKFEGHLVVYADRGKIRKNRYELPHRCGGNLVDFHAIWWLLQQPAPRFCMTDQCFTDAFASEAHALYNDAVKRKLIIPFADMDELMTYVRGSKPKPVEPPYRPPVRRRTRRRRY